MNTVLKYEGGELLVEGPGGRYAVRPYAEADEDGMVRSWPAGLLDTGREQAPDGFAVYACFGSPEPDMQDWRSDHEAMGAAIDAALDLARYAEPEAEGYATECPNCGGPLELAYAQIATSGALIARDGFALADAKVLDTWDEETRCIDCRKCFTLDGKPVE